MGIEDFIKYYKANKIYIVKYSDKFISELRALHLCEVINNNKLKFKDLKTGAIITESFDDNELDKGLKYKNHDYYSNFYQIKYGISLKNAAMMSGHEVRDFYYLRSINSIIDDYSRIVNVTTDKQIEKTILF